MMDGVWWIMVAFLGVFAGFLINYLADVLPYHRKIQSPTCLSCGRSIPFLDYVLGKSCPACGQKRSIRFWLLILICAGVVVWLWSRPPIRLGFWPGLILLLYLGVVVVIDIEHRLILHPISVVGALLGAGLGIWLHGFLPTLAGGAAGFLAMLLLYFLGDRFARLVARMRGQVLDEVALGFGDVNLSGILGLILGWPGILAGLGAAILLGGAASVIFIAGQLILRQYKPFTAIPYAPFLVIGTIIFLYR
jgi:leader peptidase (prepilin peptidase)/N-methyltransferase